MKIIVKAALAAMVMASATGCASTSNKEALVAPDGAEYVMTGESDHPHGMRMVAKMDDVDDYTLDGATTVKKAAKRSHPRTKFSSSFGY